MKKLLISYLNVLSYFILFILFFVALIECIQFKMVPEMCFPKEAEITECHGKYKYNCGDFVCTKNEYSCQMLSLFSVLKGDHFKKYESFLNEIKECPEPPKYKWQPNHVCLNTNGCETTLLRIWPYNKIKITACKCTGKYIYKCNRVYCALSKLACDGLKKNATKIKQCFKKN